MADSVYSQMSIQSLSLALTLTHRIVQKWASWSEAVEWK